MDIEILLWFQNFRSTSGNVLTPFMTGLSYLANFWLLLVPLVIYWGFSKDKGVFAYVGLEFAFFAGRVAEIAVCSLRPSAVDSRIIPLFSAGGYSFPSGHTITAAAVYGGLACLTWKKSRPLSVLLVVIMILTALSRNYAGVHFMADTSAGLLIGLASLCIAGFSLKSEKRTNIAMLCGIALCVLAMIYAAAKSYPEGPVNPAKPIRNVFYGAGAAAGVILGLFAERKYVKFSATGLSIRGIILVIIGCAGYYELFFNDIMKDILRTFLPEWPMRFTLGLLTTFYVMAFWPLVIKLTERRK